MEKLKCAIYPRKSKQVDNSDSMDAQVDMCMRYLNDKYGEGNYTVQIYDGDYGITGHSIKARKDFQRMMQDIKDKKINLVLIQRYDRIARNTRDFCNLYHDMEVNGCNLVSVSQQIDTTTPYGKNFMYMQASMAELEWALSSERRKDANKYARSIGKCTLATHCFPYGYMPKYIDGIRRMVKNPEHEEITEEIFSYYKLYRNYCATAKHIKNKYGVSLSFQTIKKMIRSSYYYGEYRGNPSFCPPYITKEEWNGLQTTKPVIRMDPNKRTEILFSGMIRCPGCGRLMRSCQKTTKKGITYRYFQCEYVAYGKCDFKKMKSEIIIEQMLIDYINNFLDNASITIKTGIEEKKKKKDNTEKYKQELDRLNTMFLKGRIDENFYDAEYLRLSNLLHQNEVDTGSQRGVEELKEVFFKNWIDMYNSLDKLNKKLFWRNVVKEIIVDKNMDVIDVIFL